ncbi:MAG TPA: hypothetical protein VGL53_23920 [Bryobacteraceae bacterium]|jgi:hypothetical protein
MERWCTVTVTDAEGRRHSLDVQATSTYDAAHLYVTHSLNHPASGLPNLTTSSVFEVVIDSKVHRVEGASLHAWIERQKSELKGPKGRLFSLRPTF